MRKILLTTLFTIFTATFYAQNFAPVGAEWYYQEGHAFSDNIDYIKFTSEKDTLIMGKVCNKITKRHSVWCNYRPKPEYLFLRNDTVFFFDEAFNKFQMLYDFSAKPADSWIIKTKLDKEIYSIVIKVDSVYSSQINGQSLRTLDITYDHRDKTGKGIKYSSTIIEKIGDLKYMFNWKVKPDMACDMNYSKGLRCYQDTNIGLYSTGIADSCDHVYNGTGVESIELLSGIEVFPNPVQGFVEITVDDYSDYSISLYDLKGRLLKKIKKFRSNTRLDLSDVNKGIYILMLKQKEQIIGYKKLMKE